jgi:hypothetical protein
VPGDPALIALVNPRFALLSDVTAFASRWFGEPCSWSAVLTVAQTQGRARAPTQTRGR